MGNSLIDLNLLGSAFMALGTAQLHMSLVGKGHLTERTTFVLIAVLDSGESGTGKGNYSKHRNNSFFHRYNLL
jgi:hypothetical protein